MDLDMPIGLQLSVLQRFFKAQMDAYLKQHELTGVQLGVLGELVKLEDEGLPEVNQRDLENATHVTHSTMTEIIKRLERKGFIVCHPGAFDRRYKSISSTERCRDLVKDIDKIEGIIFAELCRGIPEQDIGKLRSFFEIMVKNVISRYEKGKDLNA